MMKSIIGDHYPELLEEKVDVRLVLAFGKASEEDEADILKPAFPGKVPGKLHITNLRDRTRGHGDCLIEVDGDRWQKSLTDKGEPTMKSHALIDHLIAGIELITDAEGDVVYDEQKRPKLRKRKPAFTIQGFPHVADRYQADSIEREQIQEVASMWQDQLFGFMAALPSAKKAGAKKKAS